MKYQQILVPAKNGHRRPRPQFRHRIRSKGRISKRVTCMKLREETSWTSSNISVDVCENCTLCLEVTEFGVWCDY